jgi:hypothetical protein
MWRLQSWTTIRHCSQAEIIETSLNDKADDDSYHTDEDYNDEDDDNDNDDEASIVMGSVHSHMSLRESNTGNVERAVQHFKIAASAGECNSMKYLIPCFNLGFINRDEMNSILTAYNNSCAETRSEARDIYIRALIEESGE